MKDKKPEEDILTTLQARVERLERQFNANQESFDTPQFKLLAATNRFFKVLRPHRLTLHNFPSKLTLQLLDALLSSRFMIVIGTFVGLGLGILQTQILSNQTHIMDGQSSILETEALSNRVSVVTNLTNLLGNINDTSKVEIILPFVDLLGEHGTEFINKARQLQPSYLSMRAWLKFFRDLEAEVVKSEEDLDLLVSGIQDFGSYCLNHRLSYPQFSRAVTPLTNYTFDNTHLSERYTQVLLDFSGNSGPDILDLSYKILTSHFLKNQKQPLTINTQTFDPLFNSQILEFKQIGKILLPGLGDSQTDRMIVEEIGAYLIGAFSVVSQEPEHPNLQELVYLIEEEMYPRLENVRDLLNANDMEALRKKATELRKYLK